MYLKQMGQVPLLTRDQEIAISKRIEKAENNLQGCLQTVGFIAENYVQLADSLINGLERFDRLVIDQKNDDRDAYFKKLVQTPCPRPHRLGQVPPDFCRYAQSPCQKEAAAEAEFAAARIAFFKLCNKFFFKQKVNEDFVSLMKDQLKELERIERNLALNAKSEAADEALKQFELRAWTQCRRLPDAASPKPAGG